MKKIDNSFAIEQFLIGGFTPYRLDKNYFGGGIMTYVLEDLSSKYLSLIIFLLIWETVNIEKHAPTKKYT